MNFPSNLKYTKDHEWVLIDGSTGTIGITDYAQSELGDIVFVDLPSVGKIVKHGESFGTVEAVKAVSDLFAPLSGEVLEVSGAIESTPEVVNKDPYGEGWMVKIKITNPAEVSDLLDEKQYRELIGK